ncbi:hypothetical protein GGI20_005451 [Coemansia sp. BCRC 34301]|nr:hypothetical protein GGI20_005451 [Coemansia sp. BCRC 34301]
MSDGPAMAVGTRQQAGEYDRTIEYIRKLCEGGDDGGHELATSGAQKRVRDAASRFGKSGGATDDSRSTIASSNEQAPQVMPIFGPCIGEASACLAEASPTKPRTRQKANGAASAKLQSPGEEGRQESGAACRLVGGTSHDAANDTCDTCGQPGQFICCELCPRVFHFMCVEPPMSQEEVSKIDHWYCRACQHLVTRKRKSRAHAKNIFYPLISDLEFRNARTFSVPDEIRRQFDGIEADADGAFINTREERPQRANMGAANRDFTRLADDHNTPIMCYRCGLSALHGPVVRCDYCPLNWHWDCLDPPLSSAPPPHRRWMCPNHADHAMPRRRKFRKERIVDLTDAPEEVRNSGIVDIVDDDPPWHELFDPKVKYRLTTSRIRKEFSKNAAVCRIFTTPTHSTQASGSDLDTQTTELLATDAGDDDAANSTPVDAPAAEWLLAIADFQKDVARYIADPERRAELRSACHKGRCGGSELGEIAVDSDKMALLSVVATQILTPQLASAGVEGDAQQSSKRKRVLAENNVCEADFRAAATRLLNCSSLRKGDCKDMASRGNDDDGRSTLADSGNIIAQSEPGQNSTCTAQLPVSPVAADEMNESRHDKLDSASDLVESLLRKKGADALVAFLLSD